jgi:hypothetical protein
MENKSLSEKILNSEYTFETKNVDSKIIFWAPFKLNNYWEIKQYSNIKIIFWKDDSLKVSNLLNRILNNKEYLSYPYENKDFLKLKNIIKFQQDLTLKEFNKFLDNLNNNIYEIVILDETITKKFIKLISSLREKKILVFSSNKLDEKFITIPNIFEISDLIKFWKEKKIYYCGKKIDLPYDIEYFFTNNNTFSKNFLNIEIDNIKKPKETYYLNRKNVVKNEVKINLIDEKKIEKIKKNQIIQNLEGNNFIIETPEEEIKLIRLHEIKKYFQKLNNKEYPNRTKIHKINFLIDNLPLIDETMGELVLYQFNIMINLTTEYLVFYNGILINDKLDKNKLNLDKFKRDFILKRESNSFLLENIFNMDKNEFNIIFYTLSDYQFLNLYKKLPFPKILISGIIPFLWQDDRHIISMPSKMFMDVISSEILKNQNDEIIHKPEREFYLEPFLPEVNNKLKNLKETYLVDYLIAITWDGDENKLELKLLIDIIENSRNKYQKDIHLLLINNSNIELDTEINFKFDWISFTNFPMDNFLGIDLIIFLDTCITSNYQLPYLLLQCLSYHFPVILPQNNIFSEYLGNNYSGYYLPIKDDLGKILEYKKIILDKLNKIIKGEILDEQSSIEMITFNWNKKTLKNYTKQFNEIITFLNNKNFKRNTNFNNLIENQGFNLFYHEIINNLNLPQIYQNVEEFFELIKDYKNILLISSDYPGYGGASTLNNELAKIFELKGHTCREIYYLFNSLSNQDEIIKQFRKPVSFIEKESNDFFYNKIRVVREKDLTNDLEKMDFKPDLIILKNHLNGHLIPEKFNNIYYLVAGIFSNNLNKYFFDLTDTEIEKFVNSNVINLLKNPKITGIVNSSHTQKILKDKFNLETKLFYTNFIPKYPQKLPTMNNSLFEKRPYTYGIICSDFNRPIKNLENSIIELKEKLVEGQKVILIGKNSQKYQDKKNNIEAIDLIPSYLVDDYLKKIKYLISNSYYESCSNLVIQAKYNGCQVLRNPLENKEKTLKILIASTQYPNYGGSATNAYKLIKNLRSLNYQVIGIFYNRKIIDMSKLDPDNIGDIYHLQDDVDKMEFIKENEVNNVKNEIIKKFKGYPDLIFSFNYYTPILSKILFPYCHNFYFIVGNPILTIGQNSIINQGISIQKFLKEDFTYNYDQKTYDLEKITFKNSEGVIIDQGALNIETTGKVHPEYKYLLNNFYNYGVNILLKDLENYTFEKNHKEFDIIAISSNWKREVKNPKLLYNILKELPQYRKLVIGENSDAYEHLPNIMTLDLVPYQQAQEYLSKSKLLIIPSFSETGSNTIIEAFFNNCQVITSKNVGYQYFLKDFQLCDDVYDVDQWLDKINFILNNFKTLPIPKIEVDDYQYKFLNYLNTFKTKREFKVLVVCGDKPYYGGAATNSYNLIKLLRKNKISCVGLFISYMNEGLDDPENLGDVYHIFLDESIETRLKAWKLSNYFNNFDIIFCKNYKVFSLINKLYPYIKIIYSPSGLRQITAEISGRKKYYQELENLNIDLIDKDHQLIEENNWYHYIMKNDRYLENQVLKEAGILLPNSKITYDILKKYYPELTLNQPIYLTNINHLEQSNFNFSKRKYDFGFIATSWKRATKNLDLVKKLIDHESLKEYKFIVIGSDHNIKLKNDNLTLKEHLSHDDLIKELRNIKSVIITSYYDSNPNVLIEATMSGCNVVSSLNVGNAENLRRELIVVQPNKIDNWINTMIKGTQKLYPFLGLDTQTVEEEFINLLDFTVNQIDSVGIYKVNPLWDTTEKIKADNKIDFQWLSIEEITDFEEHQGRRTDIFGNIYLHLYQKVIEKLGFKNNHFIFIDETIEIPKRILWNKINIWILNKKEQVMVFNTAKFYFVRGNYPYFYQKLINDNSYTIFYPATSFKFNYNLKKNNKILKKDLESNFNFKQASLYDKFKLVLIHEDPIYSQQYKNNKKLLLGKYALDDFYLLEDKIKSVNRKYDLIMVAQALQKSKNHQLFFDFIKYCDEHEIPIKIAYVSNQQVLKETYSNFYLPNNENIILDFYDNLSPNELNLLYNNSKINIILSHRDCVPRVIPESLACGCYNLSTDLLSDGKFYYDGIFGELLSLDYAEVELGDSGNLSYVSNPFIFKKIIRLISQEYNHQQISEEFKKKYNLNSMVEEIYKQILN